MGVGRGVRAAVVLCDARGQMITAHRGQEDRGGGRRTRRGTLAGRLVTAVRDIGSAGDEIAVQVSPAIASTPFRWPIIAGVVVESLLTWIVAADPRRPTVPGPRSPSRGRRLRPEGNRKGDLSDFGHSLFFICNLCDLEDKADLCVPSDGLLC
ncbi:hypothetical protein Pve01_68440 [Planomonospora venezuelensis]|nr:hypothetical protein Pve01_68440 [Planomonospora venezuelensis]